MFGIKFVYEIKKKNPQLKIEIGNNTTDTQGFSLEQFGVKAKA